MAKLHANLKGIIALLGDRMYSGSPIETAVKELLQNSFDAIKTELKNGLTQGLIDLEYDCKARTICITDNGCGMTSEVVTKAFFGIAETYKEGLSTDERSGGFGAAKVQFLLFPDWMELHTVKSGTETSCRVSREELIEGVEFSLKQEPTSKANGTSVTICIPKMNNKGVALSFVAPTGSSIKKYLPMGNVKVHVHGTYGNEVYNCNSLFEYPFIGTAETCFGLLDIYMGNLNNYPTTARVTVYSAGIRQFEEWYGSYDRKQAPVIINVRPCVDAHHELYPINNQRQGWSTKVNAEVKDLYSFLSKICHSVEGKKIKSLFSKSTTNLDGASTKEVFNEGDALNEAVKQAWSQFSAVETTNTATSESRQILSVAKVSQALKEEKRDSTFKGFDIAFEEIKIDTSNMDINKAVIYNNTDLNIGAYSELINELGAMLIQFRELLVESGSFVGRSSQYFGIAFDKHFQGVNVNPSMFDFIGVNPFSFDFNMEGVNCTAAVTENLLHIILHELAHNKVSGHNAEFCAVLGRVYGAVCGLPWFHSWKENLYDLVEANMLLIVEATNAYQKSKNIGDTILEEKG